MADMHKKTRPYCHKIINTQNPALLHSIIKPAFKCADICHSSAASIQRVIYTYASQPTINSEHMDMTTYQAYAGSSNKKHKWPMQLAHATDTYTWHEHTAHTADTRNWQRQLAHGTGSHS